jgi:hypothetical protein
MHSNRKFGSHCFCKIKKPNKNFLKSKCDWWYLYFDTTDSYLRFIPTNGQTTVCVCECVHEVRLRLCTNIVIYATVPQRKSDVTSITVLFLCDIQELRCWLQFLYVNWKKSSSSPRAASVFISLSFVHLYICGDAASIVHTIPTWKK